VRAGARKTELGEDAGRRSSDGIPRHRRVRGSWNQSSRCSSGGAPGPGLW
jgi:hypothetical protein